ncbi:MAG TPA: response regulator [Candidatus Limnocylindria bacterium]|nr:response regulator [Candidatus Limnocylindria bacterium]
MSDTQTLTAARTPTVYFIDDSATMREVIKIAFRKENIHVITCPDAASALAQFGEAAPDAVITDVIMPDKDGYEVCEFIKQHEQLGKTPVILMSGVVNRTVAEKAMAVKADELIRKPFQPQDLIIRVKNLLYPKAPVTVIAGDAGDSSRAASSTASNPLTSLFSPGAPAFSAGRPEPGVVAPAPRAAAPPSFSAQRAAGPPPADIQKLRNEIRRLELLVKKLQAELEAEHQYCAALEAHFKTLQEGS